MPKIKLLDEDTINKIAAGEVIERPASVVKELVENSIDAGARKILIEVVEGGKKIIRVTDDGCGMDVEDLPLAFQKHATSKIAGARDLDNISTLGFRGEALSSIASVARSIEVQTKTRSSLSGVLALIENGRITEIKEIGCPMGTAIAVSDLFYNVPARRKHLKSAEAELAHITDLVTEMAIINYGVSFELFTGRRTLFKSAKSSSWDDVLLRVFGLSAAKGLVSFQVQADQWSLKGLAGDPLNTRSSPDRIFIYVNGRAVYSKSLTAALRGAYRNLIPTGRSPIAILSLDLTPELVDVNVHPAKKEIRLLREEEIATQLVQAVAEALHTGSQPRPAEAIPRTELPVQDGIKLQSPTEQRTLPLEAGGEMWELSVRERPAIKILGQALKLYIVAEGDQGLMLIDQHAAAERIRFEQLLEKYESRRISQELAEPLTIELAPHEQLLLESWQAILAEMGFDLSPFGGNTYHIRAVPALGSRLERPEAVHDILRDLFSMGKVAPGSTSRDDILKLLACKGSIKSGKEMSSQEMHKLLEELYACKNPLTCPHGRPIMVMLDQGQLEKLFFRR